jgi:hypothetical protein
MVLAQDVARLTDLVTGASNPFSLEARVASFEDTFYQVRKRELAMKDKVGELSGKITRLFAGLAVADSVVANQGGFGIEHLNEAQIISGLKKGKERIARHKARKAMSR